MKTYNKRVAVIGAGPGGLAAARYLKAHGFIPAVYDGAGRLGGQWDSGASEGSAPMRAHTSRLATRFSGLDYPGGAAGFRDDGQVLAYLEAYVEKFGLGECLRLDTEVETIARHPAGGWVVHSTRGGEPPRTELYPRVVVATGRFSRKAPPDIAGLDGFAGAGGVLHSFDYEGPERFAGQTVIVAGSSIGAVEIACDLARAGVKVISTARRHRSMLRKDFARPPSHNVALTRFAALAGDCLPLETVACGLERFLANSSAFPAEFAGLPPVGDVFASWIALSEEFLRLVGEGRVAARPLLESVEGASARFADGSSVDLDAIVFDSGFDLDLPFLDLKTRGILDLDGSSGLELADCTFHPDLEGLALVGLFPQASQYFPVVELQARWVAYVWAGLAPVPSRAELPAGFPDKTVRRSVFRDEQARSMALRFA